MRIGSARADGDGRHVHDSFSSRCMSSRRATYLRVSWLCSKSGVVQRGWPRSIDTTSCPAAVRSEEHTSELQSLMRISYAVFCLKKKNTYKHKENAIRTRLKRKHT